MSYRDDEWVDVDLKVIRATEKAVKVQHENGEDWIPRSCIDGGEDIIEGDHDVYGVKSWKARDLGLEEG